MFEIKYLNLRSQAFGNGEGGGAHTGKVFRVIMNIYKL